MTRPSRGTPLGLAPAGATDPKPSEGRFTVRRADLRTSIRPTVAEVDLRALRHNAAVLRAVVGAQTQVYGVVKADAYGHGAVEVGTTLSGLVDGLAVSLAEEGCELREAGVEGPVLVLGAFYGDRHSEIIEAGLTPVVYDFGDLERFATAPVRRRLRSPGPATGASARVDIHIKIDTGMSRLGFAMDELDGLLERLARWPRLRVTGVCTHFSNADCDDEAVTQAQLDRFAQALARLRTAGLEPGLIHAANSAGAVRFPAARFSAVRPGLALYGAVPAPLIKVTGLVPALSLHTRIMAVHELAPDTPVSYGGLFRTRRRSRIATLPVGYADGYPRHVRGAEVLVGGRRVPVVGSVCMDMLMIDVTDVGEAAIGADVVLIGEQGGARITIDDVAGWAATINYEILCGLSKRVPRLYRDDDGAVDELDEAG